MNDHLEPAADLARHVERWRERALGYLLLTVLAVGAIPLVVIALEPHSITPALRWWTFGLYAATAALRIRRIPYRLRAWMVVTLNLTLAGTMLSYRGLEGSGRVVLVTAPLFATVLIGARAGYAVAGVALAVYGGAGYLTATGILASLSAPSDALTPTQAWVLQGSVLLLVIGPAVVLVNQFVILLRDALRTEREWLARTAGAERERRRLERVLLETGERERVEIGHQLHDGPCQELTAALLRCKVVANSLTARGSNEEAAHLDHVGELLEEAVGEIHDLARGLSPGELPPDALPAALCDLARRFGGSSGVDIRVVHDGNAQPDDAGGAGQLFRIAQEAVRNAVSHAGPSRVLMELSEEERVVSLVIRDDGSGIPAARRDGGMGLRIMRHRAELIGGSLDVGPAPGGGTVVKCLLPRRTPEAVRA